MVPQIFTSSNIDSHRGTQGTIRCDISKTPRYILVDWLVEVATIKECSDCYTALCTIGTANLLLLGITCIVVHTGYTRK